MRPDSAQVRAVALILIGVLAVCVLRDGWVGDDAYITLRTVKNFVRGHGLVWNPGERVQAYTHPLWMFVLSIGYGITREAFFTTLVTCLIFNFAAVWLLLRANLGRGWVVVPMMAALICSRAVVDYSTSGLENPMSHFLVVLFFFQYLKYRGRVRQFRWLAFIAALAMLNRMDTILLFAPALAVMSWRRIRNGEDFVVVLWDGVVAFSPFLVWELFSLVYYGSLVPNTALAKLGSGVPKNEMLLQGLLYFGESLQNDHPTLLVIFFGMGVPWLVGREKSKLLPFAAGLLAYLAYIVWVGGDFMSGRFFTTPLFLAVAMISRLAQLQGASAFVFAGIVLVVGISTPRSTLAFGQHRPVYGRIDERGIADERGFYHPTSGLMQMARKWRAPNSGMRFDGERLSTAKPNVRFAVGYVGFFAARRAYVVDAWALVDPLLARLPMQRHFLWRIGHFQRALPDGYVESIDTGENKFKDKELGQFYEHIKRITRGPLFTVERWKSIYQLHTGKLEKLINRPKYRFWGAREYDYQAASAKIFTSRTKLDEPGVVTIDQSGVHVRLGRVRHDKLLEVSTDCDDDYIAIFFQKRREVGRRTYRRAIPRSSGLRRKIMKIPDDVVEEGYDAIRIVPGLGFEPFAFGHLRVYDERPADLSRPKKKKAASVPEKVIVPPKPAAAKPQPATTKPVPAKPGPQPATPVAGQRPVPVPSTGKLNPLPKLGSPAKVAPPKPPTSAKPPLQAPTSTTTTGGDLDTEESDDVGFEDG